MRSFRGIGMTSQRTRDRLAKRLEEQGIRDRAVLEALRHTPRHIFVDEALASRAYEDTALPIGYGQTISQPFIVARMSEAATAGGRPERVLEIGTGCGYQTAILAQLSGMVYSVERIEPLLRQARERLYALKLNNVKLAHSDGTWGWAGHAPYDAIVVTAAPAEVPEELYRQMAPGGRLVIPVGPPGMQELRLIVRERGGLRSEVLDRVVFVPMVKGTG